MRRTLLLVLCLLCLAQPALAEDFDYAWTLQLGGDGITAPKAMAVSYGGGVFVVGHTTSENGMLGESLGESDGFVLWVDAGGAVRWLRRLGGSGEDRLTHVIAMADGGCVAMGTTNSGDGDARSSRGGQDAWVVRLDSEGELLWSKCLGGSLDDELDVLRADEEYLFVCGRSHSRNGDLRANYGSWDAWATALNPDDGKPVWTYRYGFQGDDRFTTAYPVYEGWLLLGEASEELPVEEGDPQYVARPIVQIIGLDGEPLWETPITLGDTTGISRLFAIAETDTGWLLAGETNSRFALMPMPQGGMDIWVLHLRSNGTIAWQRTYGGSQDESLHSIIALQGGGFLLLGETNSSDNQVFGAHGEQDVWLVRISSSGLTQWQQPIGGSKASMVCNLLQSADGALLVAGTTASQDGDIGRHRSVRTGFLCLLASNGNLLQTDTVADGEECTLVDMQANEGDVYLLGCLRSVDASGPIETLWLARPEIDGYWENHSL